MKDDKKKEIKSFDDDKLKRYILYTKQKYEENKELFDFALAEKLKRSSENEKTINHINGKQLKL